MSAPRRLIVTADDFGVSPEVNRAVQAAHRGGILRFASLMAKGPAFEDAVKIARANPGLGVGLHLELCPDKPELWGLKFYFQRSLRAFIEGQIRAQLDRCLQFGLRPTHVDGHFNIHVHPVVFPILAKASRAAGIPRIRLPGGEVGAGLSYAWSKGRWADAAASLGLGGVFGALRRQLAGRAEGLRVPERTLGLLRSGMMSEDYLLWLIDRLPPGTTEVYFHPSDDPASAVTDRPTPTHRTVTELRTLMSPRVKDALAGAEIRLVRPEESGD